jgi:hypothetical protein
VARERLGKFEDQFFTTVVLASYARDPTAFSASSTYLYARHMVAQIFNVCALRMAAVFLISQATLWLRTGVMPRWLALPT